MLQPYPETLDDIQIMKANPGNKWVRSPAQKKCQLMAVGLHRADQNLNAALGFRREASSSIVLAQGPLSHFGHGQEGSKAEETAVVRPAGGVEGAQITQLPSFKLMLKELRARNAAMILHTSSLERLVKSQAKPDAEQQPPPIVPSSSKGGVGHSAAGGTPRRRLRWPFGQRGRSAAGDRGPLFGRSLSELCSQEGMLTQPIQDLLALPQEHGSSMEGIFLLAASECASREIREALDRGVVVQLQSQPVHLLAVILKAKPADTQPGSSWLCCC
ncbi:hypothetical protein Q9233_008149 [Columba guinea]|nr:hypothetical protein Q9233_008149 [Columba guinea]